MKRKNYLACILAISIQTTMTLNTPTLAQEMENSEMFLDESSVQLEEETNEVNLEESLLEAEFPEESIFDEETIEEIELPESDILMEESDIINTEVTKNDIASVDRDSVEVGESITITADVGTEEGEYTYSYLVHNLDTNSWYRLSPFQENNTYQWVAGSTGIREFYVEVKDAEGTIVRSAPILVKTEENVNKLKILGSIDKTEGHVGDEIAITAEASGGEGEYTYSYLVHNLDTDGWYRLSPFQENSSYKWLASSTGTREFFVEVKDEKGTVVRSQSLVAKVTEDVNKLTIVGEIDKTESTVGDKVTLTANASGGKGEYTYSYLVHNLDTDGWFRLSPFQEKNSYEWTAGSVGTREFFIEVKDETGTVVRSKSLIVKTAEANKLQITADIDKTTATVGDKVTISATADGGKGKYAYSYLVHNIETDGWFRFNQFQEENSYEWTAGSVGLREFFVEVKDEAGSIERSEPLAVQVYETNEYNVNDYGAVPNDEISDYNAIQKCLDQAAQNEGFTVVKIPEGVYYIDNTLRIYSNTRLELSDATVIKRKDVTKIMLTSASNSKEGGYQQADNITIVGGAWDGNYTDSLSVGNMMWFKHAQNITIKNCSIGNTCSYHLIAFAGTQNIDIENVRFHDNHMLTSSQNLGAFDNYFLLNEDGEIDWYNTAASKESVHFDLANEEGEYGAVPYDNTFCRNITVRNCKFENVLSGIGTHHNYDSFAAMNVNILNNAFENVAGKCVNAYGLEARIIGNTASEIESFLDGEGLAIQLESNNINCKNPTSGTEIDVIHAVNGEIKIKNNEICGSDNNAIYLSKVTNNTTVENNIISSSGKHAIALYDGEAQYISNNRINDSLRNGIVMKNSKVQSIVSNNIENTQEDAIYIIDSKISGNIGGNTIQGNKLNAIYLSNTKADVIENTIKNTEKQAILMENAKNSKIEGNTIEETDLEAIVCYNVSGTVTNNTVTNSGGSSIFCNNCKELDVVKNNIESSGKHGISIYNNSLINNLKENTIFDSKGHGIYIENSEVTALENAIDTSKENGISGGRNSKITALGNNIQNTGNIAIGVASCSADIENNVVSGDCKTAISIYGGDAKVIANEISNTTERTIIVTGQAKVSDIIQNKIESSEMNAISIYNKSEVENISENSINLIKQVGIIIDDSSVSNIKKNNITNTILDAISVRNSQEVKMNLEENVIEGCSGNAIYLSSAKADVTANTIKDTEKQAILIENAENSKIEGNNIEETDLEAIVCYNVSGVLADNVIKNSGSSSIFCNNCNKLDITKNNIETSGKHGISIYNNSVINNLKENTIFDSKGHGIYIENSEVTALENAIDTSKENGISGGQNAKIIALRNKIQNTDNIAIGVASCSVDLENNIISGNSKTAISIYGGDAKVIANEIANTTEKAIIVTGKAKVSDIVQNKIESSEMNAISIYNKSEVENINENSINLIKQTGIVIDDSSVSNMKKNNITNTILDAISVRNSKEIKINIEENVVEGCSGNAISMSDSTGNVIGNNINAAEKNGIIIVNGLETNLAKNNVVGCTGMGMQIIGGQQANISANTISNNMSHGIQLNSSKTNTLEKNSIFENTGNGVHVYKSEGTIFDGNEIARNNGYGIACSYAENTEMKNNVITDNGIKDIFVVNSSTGSSTNDTVSSKGIFVYDQKKFFVTQLLVLE